MPWSCKKVIVWKESDNCLSCEQNAMRKPVLRSHVQFIVCLFFTSFLDSLSKSSFYWVRFPRIITSSVSVGIFCRSLLWLKARRIWWCTSFSLFRLNKKPTCKQRKEWIDDFIRSSTVSNSRRTTHLFLQKKREDVMKKTQVMRKTPTSSRSKVIQL